MQYSGIKVKECWKKLCGGVSPLPLRDTLGVALVTAEAAQPSISLTQDTTLPLKQGSLALSSEISSLTTLGEKQADTYSQALSDQEKGRHSAARRHVPLLPALIHAEWQPHVCNSHFLFFSEFWTSFAPFAVTKRHGGRRDDAVSGIYDLWTSRLSSKPKQNRVMEASQCVKGRAINQ